MKIRQFISELKRRKVFRVASVYVVTAWLLIEIAATTFPMFEFPDWTARFVVILSIIGFPIALSLAWAYEVKAETNPENKKEEEDNEEEKKIWVFRWQTPVIVIMIGIIGFLVWNSRQQRANSTNILPESVRSEKVAVAVFNNFTNDPNLDAFGSMASEWIASGLRELKIRTSSPEMMRKCKENVGILPNNPSGKVSLLELTNAQYVVTGSYYQKGDSLQITSRLESTETGDIIYEFPTLWGKKSQKEDLIIEIREKLKGFWDIKMRRKLSIINPPKYEAYQAFLECSVLDPDCFEKVLTLDSTFLLARTYLAFTYQLYEQDSLYRATATYLKQQWSKCTEFEKNYFIFAESSKRGDYEAALNAINKNFQLDPNDLGIIHMSAYAFLFVNQPLAAVNRYKVVFDKHEIYKDQISSNMYNGYYYALNRLGRQKEVIEFDEKLQESQHNQKEVIRALMLEKNLPELRNRIENIPQGEYLEYAFMFNAIFPSDSNNIFKELVRNNFTIYKDPAKTLDYLFWTNIRGLKNYESKAFAHYVLSEWEQTEKILLGLRNMDWKTYSKGFKNNTGPKYLPYRHNVDWYMSVWIEGLLGCTYARQGRMNLAHAQIEKLGTFSQFYPKVVNRFHKGVISYSKARIYAILGEKDKSVSFLTKSMEEGRVIDWGSFVYDWDLANLKGYEPYESLVKPQ